MESLPLKLVPSSQRLLVNTLNGVLDRPPLHHSGVLLLRTFGRCANLDHAAMLRRLPSIVHSREIAPAVMTHLYTTMRSFPPECAAECNGVRASVVSEALEQRISDEPAAAPQLWGLAANATAEHFEWITGQVALRPLQYGMTGVTLSRVAEVAVASGNASLREAVDLPFMLGQFDVALRKVAVTANRRRIMRVVAALAVEGRDEAAAMLPRVVEGRGIGATFEWLADMKQLVSLPVCSGVVEEALVSDIAQLCLMSGFGDDVVALRCAWDDAPAGRRLLEMGTRRALERVEAAVEAGSGSTGSSNGSSSGGSGGITALRPLLNAIANIASLATSLPDVESLAGLILSEKGRSVVPLSELEPCHVMALLTALERLGATDAQLAATQQQLLADKTSPLRRIDDATWDAASATLLAEFCRARSGVADADVARDCRALVASIAQDRSFNAQLRDRAAAAAVQ